MKKWPTWDRIRRAVVWFGHAVVVLAGLGGPWIRYVAAYFTDTDATIPPAVMAPTDEVPPPPRPELLDRIAGVTLREDVAPAGGGGRVVSRVNPVPYESLAAVRSSTSTPYESLSGVRSS